MKVIWVSKGFLKLLKPAAFFAFLGAVGLVLLLSPNLSYAGGKCSNQAHKKEFVTKIRGSKLTLYEKADKSSAKTVIKKKEAKKSLPAALLDASHKKFYKICFNNEEKWVRAHKVKVGHTEVKISCLQVSQKTGSSRGAGEDECSKK